MTRSGLALFVVLLVACAAPHAVGPACQAIDLAYDACVVLVDSAGTRVTVPRAELVEIHRARTTAPAGSTP